MTGSPVKSRHGRRPTAMSIATDDMTVSHRIQTPGIRDTCYLQLWAMRCYYWLLIFYLRGDMDR
ncbi:hypothetical protein BJX76DRAFT_102907 [Aspergillus varians]